MSVVKNDVVDARNYTVGGRLNKDSVKFNRETTAIIKARDIDFSVTLVGEISPAKDLKNLIVLSHVNQADVSRMAKHQIAKIEIKAVADLIIDGIVERIAPQATIRNSIKGFSTRIKLLTSNPDIIPGMIASINIPVASVDNVVAAPLAAIFTERNETKQRTEIFAYVKNGDSDIFNKAMLEVGVNDLNHIEVLRGLKVGDVVSIEKPDDGKIGETISLEVGVNDLNNAEVLRGLKVGDIVAIEKPDDDKIGETISLDGKVVTKSEPEKNPLVEKYDKNGDGKLDREEIQTAVASMTDEEKKKMREMMMKRFRRGPR